MHISVICHRNLKYLTLQNNTIFKNLMKKKILITGGGGFIGGHLANFYHKKGFKVTCVDLKKKSLWFQVNPKIKNI